MPKYFFNMDGAIPSIDDDGEELPDNEAAWNEAVQLASEIFKDIDGKLRPQDEWSLEVSDGLRTPLYRIHIRSEQLN